MHILDIHYELMNDIEKYAMIITVTVSKKLKQLAQNNVLFPLPGCPKGMLFYVGEPIGMGQRLVCEKSLSLLEVNEFIQIIRENGGYLCK